MVDSAIVAPMITRKVGRPAEAGLPTTDPRPWGRGSGEVVDGELDS